MKITNFTGEEEITMVQKDCMSVSEDFDCDEAAFTTKSGSSDSCHFVIVKCPDDSVSDAAISAAVAALYA